MGLPIKPILTFSHAHFLTCFLKSRVQILDEGFLNGFIAPEKGLGEPGRQILHLRGAEFSAHQLALDFKGQIHRFVLGVSGVKERDFAVFVQHEHSRIIVALERFLKPLAAFVEADRPFHMALFEPFLNGDPVVFDVLRVVVIARRLDGHDFQTARFVACAERHQKRRSIAAVRAFGAKTSTRTILPRHFCKSTGAGVFNH